MRFSYFLDSMIFSFMYYMRMILEENNWTYWYHCISYMNDLTGFIYLENEVDISRKQKKYINYEMRTKYRSYLWNFCIKFFFVFFYAKTFSCFNFSLCNSNNLSVCVSPYECTSECVRKLWKISKGVCMCIFECVV